MCGIIGIYGGNLGELNKATRALEHRGPDDFGIYIDNAGEIGLGQTRLSIIDLTSSGHQPMISDDEMTVLVFNGEIYNYKELRAELEEKGIRFQGGSDTEVLMRLYALEGMTMLPRLNGIFAFAIWDKHTDSLFIARDAFGIKPIYYSVDEKSFSFASEIKALITLEPSKHSEIDFSSLHRYLSFIWCPGDGTPFKSVKKLLPGEAILVKSGKIFRKWNWYDLPIFRKSSHKFKKINEVIKELPLHLQKAVERQMVSDVPVGSFLSGGLDSSSIVLFAKNINPDIKCYTISVDENESENMKEDLRYSRIVARHLNVNLEVVKVSPGQFAADLEEMIVGLDEPIADPAALNVLYISRMARKQGIKVLLSGVGGDDIFTGYRRHSIARFEQIWDRIPLLIRQVISRRALGFNQNELQTRRLIKYLSGIDKGGDDRLVNYYSWLQEDNLMKLYSPEFLASLSGALAAQPMLDFLMPVSEKHASLEKMLSLEQRFFLGDHNLIYTDKMSMMAGVEVRVPFLDLDLVNFASKVPASMKQHLGINKWVLKKAMEPFLPRDVIYRKKTGFGLPLREWIKSDLRDWADDLLSITSLKKRGYFDPVAVRKLIDANHSGKVDASYTLLSLMAIEIWCRNFLDKQFSSLNKL